MILNTILEGLGLGALLMLVCAIGIRNGAIGLVHLYSQEVQQRVVELGLTTREKIRRNSMRFKAICIPVYLAYLLTCVYAINGARGFSEGLWQILVILAILSLIDRILIDGFWVGHTKAWVIAGTEDLMPYISKAEMLKKTLSGTAGMVLLALALAGAMALILP